MSKSIYWRGVAFRHHQFHGLDGFWSALKQGNTQWHLKDKSGASLEIQFGTGDSAVDCRVLLQDAKGIDRLALDEVDQTIWFFSNNSSMIKQVNTILQQHYAVGAVLYWRPWLPDLVRHSIFDVESNLPKLRAIYGTISGDVTANSIVLFAEQGDSLSSSEAFRLLRRSYKITPRSCKFQLRVLDELISVFLDAHGNVSVQMSAGQVSIDTFFSFAVRILQLGYFEEVSSFPLTKKAELREMEVFDD